ncbi:MAG: hypothetical protein HRU20_24340 [Pseudomonadales bacterium]|nr:hypothetical protein [Pseudomonadales bacterium]
MSKRRLLTLSILLLCSHQAMALFGSKCKHADKMPEPDWVTAGFSYEKTGFRYGFGHVLYQSKQSYEKQLANAENLARADLIKSLQVEVKSELDVQTRETSHNKKVNFKQDIVQRISTRSKLELPGLAIKEKWQNKKTCEVYVLVELSDRMVHLVAQKALVLSYFEQGKDASFNIYTRILILANAIEITQNNDFSQLPNSQSSEHLQEEIYAQKTSLENQLASQRNAVFIVNGREHSGMNKFLFEAISAQVSGSFEGGQCSSNKQCMSQAHQTPAVYGTIYSYAFNHVREQGFYVGNFELQISVWDLNTNQLLYNSKTDAAVKPVKVMARQEHKLTIESGFEKWKRANPTALAALKKYYR